MRNFGGIFCKDARMPHIIFRDYLKMTFINYSLLLNKFTYQIERLSISFFIENLVKLLQKSYKCKF